MDRLWLFSVIAASLSFAHAQCPNYCSGHGMCDTAGGSEQCLCYKGWMDADCSERECHFEVSSSAARGCCLPESQHNGFSKIPHTDDP